MILRIRRFFEAHLVISETTSPQDTEHNLRLAAASLMLEMIHVDGKSDIAEDQRIRNILDNDFGLTRAETEELLTLAHEEKTDATDYYQFTSLINQHYSQQQKIKLVEYLWKIAYADGSVDRFEEHLVRKLADLLHVPHSAFIQARHRAAETKN